MRDSLLLNKTSNVQLGLYLKQPSQGLLLYGEVGTGKKTLAKALAAELLKVKQGKLAIHPYYIEIQKDLGKQTIGIDAVRNLRGRLSLKTTGSGWPRRVVVIANSEHMGIEPQNMMLKMLEEPPKDTVFILTTSNTLGLLPTVRSRLQKLAVLPISEKQAVDYFSKKFENQKIVSAWNLSSGSAGLLNELLQADSISGLKESVELSKTLIGLSTFERLLYVDKLSKGKDVEAIDNLFEALLKVLAAVHRSSVINSKSNSTSILKKRTSVLKLYAQLRSGANSRLLLCDLMLTL